MVATSARAWCAAMSGRTTCCGGRRSITVWEVGSRNSACTPSARALCQSTNVSMGNSPLCLKGCGGGRFCQHGTMNTLCLKGCGGNSFCQHGTLKTLCLQGCGGNSICQHGRQRTVCKEEGCGGGGLCKHGRRRSVCEDQGCGGGSICKHGRPRSRCKDCKEEGCGGGGLCMHGRRRDRCKEGCGKQMSAVLSAKDDAGAKQAKTNGVIFVATLTFAAARPLRRARRPCHFWWANKKWQGSRRGGRGKTWRPAP